MFAERKARQKKTKEDEERTKAAEAENDFFAQTGKDRKPRASESKKDAV